MSNAITSSRPPLPEDLQGYIFELAVELYEEESRTISPACDDDEVYDELYDEWWKRKGQFILNGLIVSKGVHAAAIKQLYHAFAIYDMSFDETPKTPGILEHALQSLRGATVYAHAIKDLTYYGHDIDTDTNKKWSNWLRESQECALKILATAKPSKLKLTISKSHTAFLSTINHHGLRILTLHFPATETTSNSLDTIENCRDLITRALPTLDQLKLYALSIIALAKVDTGELPTKGIPLTSLDMQASQRLGPPEFHIHLRSLITAEDIAQRIANFLEDCGGKLRSLDICGLQDLAAPVMCFPLPPTMGKLHAIKYRLQDDPSTWLPQLRSLHPTFLHLSNITIENPPSLIIGAENEDALENFMEEMVYWVKERRPKNSSLGSLSTIHCQSVTYGYARRLRRPDAYAWLLRMERCGRRIGKRDVDLIAMPEYWQDKDGWIE